MPDATLFPPPEPPASSPLGEAPFTLALAREAGITRAGVRRRLEQGGLRRVLRGVYADAHLPDGPSLRARSLSLAVSPETLVVDRTAAWLHGLWDGPGGVLDVLDVHGRDRRGAGRRRPLTSDDVGRWGGVRATTPLRSAADVARLVGPAEALWVLDRLLAAGTRHAALLGAVAGHAGLPGEAQLRRLAPWADPRARGRAESALRLCWLAAGLPTPVVGQVVATPLGPARFAVSHPAARFAAVLASAWDGPHAAAAATGWTVVPVPGTRLLEAGAVSGEGLVAGHLRREHHRHLLIQVGA